MDKLGVGDGRADGVPQIISNRREGLQTKRGTSLVVNEPWRGWLRAAAHSLSDGEPPIRAQALVA